MKHSLNRFLLIATLVINALALTAPASADDDILPEAIVTQAFIELHTGPGRGYPVFHIVERGDRVRILKRRTDWIKVRTLPFGPMELDRNQEPIAGTNTKEGWVHVDAMAATVNEQGEHMVLPSKTFADLVDPHWQMGMAVGVFENSDAVSGYLGYQFTRNLALEFEASEDFGNFSSGRNLTVSILHQPFPHWRYSPYFTMGGGERETNPRSTIVGTEDRTDGVITVGGGLRVYLASQFLLRIQYKRYTILTSRDDDEEVDEWKIGISAFF